MRWNEPPAGAAEVVLADFLDQALDRLGRREPIAVSEWLKNTPELIGQARRLLLDLEALANPAAGFVGHSWQLQNDLQDAAATTEATKDLDLARLPDPFPGEFRLIRPLGAGAFGDVWLADDLALGRQVAFKTVRFGSGPRSAALLQCLREEARLLASVRHRNVVMVHAWREAACGEHHLVLQYVPGGSLADRIADEGPLPWHGAARYIADIADGLAAVHACGIVHRDVKPANVLWHPEMDEAILTDFGVSARLSSGGPLAGTPHYMPPEAFAGSVSPAQDVYALGATLFCLVTGSVPFPALTPANAVGLIGRGLPDPDPRCAVLPAPLEKAIRAALAADPAKRPTLGEFTASLRGTLNRALADSLILPTSNAPARVDLTVNRRLASGAFVPVMTTQPVAERLVRDLKIVPPAPTCVEVRTGERLRIEAQADQDGYLTVFNVGPTGNLNLLAKATAAGGGRTVHVDVELTEPCGQERLLALWTRQRLALRADELREIGALGELPTSEGYRATRDMARVKETINDLAPEEWRVAVLALVHQPAASRPG